MTRVYAIHSGSYSDQGWGPVFSSLEKAQAYISKEKATQERHYSEDFEIEVHVLDDEDDGSIYPQWGVLFDRSGNVLYADTGYGTIPFEAELHHPAIQLVPTPCHWYILDRLQAGKREDAYLLVDLFAADRDHAVKIAADARTRFLAGLVVA